MSSRRGLGVPPTKVRIKKELKKNKKMNQKTAKLINKTVRTSVMADSRIADELKDRAFKTLSRKVRDSYSKIPKNFKFAFKQQLRGAGSEKAID